MSRTPELNAYRVVIADDTCFIRAGLTKRASETNINATFSKLDLANDTEISRRVAATLLCLAETSTPVREAVSAQT